MIGIIAAMDIEVNAIKNILTTNETLVVSGIKMIKGSLFAKELIIMQSGVGKGNAAMATTVLIENFPIEKIINIGTAGGLLPEQNALDVVVSTRVVQHDFDTSTLDGKAGIGLYFDADKELLDICSKALVDMEVTVYQGLVASGDQFISEDAQLAVLEEKFPEAICAEMEAGTIAQVCAHYKKPFVVLRSLSDVAHKEGSPMEFVKYAELASKRSAEFCKRLISSI